jgi:hypothetical protein
MDINYIPKTKEQLQTEIAELINNLKNNKAGLRTSYLRNKKLIQRLNNRIQFMEREERKN